MLTCIDTCCLINLINSGVLHEVAFNIGRALQYQGLVEDEARTHHEIIKALAMEGVVRAISGDTIYASEVGRIVDTYNIGLGEAECIAISLKTGCEMASDDGKARRAAAKELGASRVIGSLGLLIDTVRGGAIPPSGAHGAYCAMLRGGAYLPKIPDDYFHRV